MNQTPGIVYNEDVFIFFTTNPADVNIPPSQYDDFDGRVLGLWGVRNIVNLCLAHF